MLRDCIRFCIVIRSLYFISVPHLFYSDRCIDPLGLDLFKKVSKSWEALDNPLTSSTYDVGLLSILGIIILAQHHSIHVVQRYLMF
jgi:hypothetical protein